MMHWAFFKYLDKRCKITTDLTLLPHLGLRVPPVHKVALLIELPALVVEAVGDLVADHPADRSLVQTIAREEDSLQDSRRELDRVLKRRVERVYNCWSSMSHRVCLVHLLP